MSVLISGAGSIGQRHLNNLKSLGIENISVCDPADPKGYSDFEKALAEVKPSIVFICSPTEHHVSQAIAAAKTGARLFIEKPLSYSMEGIDELRSLVQKNSLKAMIACNMRFHHGPKKVHELIKEGRVGSVIAARIQTGSYLPSWRPDSDYRLSYSASKKSGGAILDCIHEIDLALWHFGPASLEHASVMSAKSIGLEVDGLAELLLKHNSGVISSVHLNFIQRDYRRCCQIIGTEGSVSWDWEKGSVELYDGEGRISETFAVPESWNVNQMFLDEVESFIRVVESGGEVSCGIEDGMRALGIALEARNWSKVESQKFGRKSKVQSPSTFDL